MALARDTILVSVFVAMSVGIACRRQAPRAKASPAACVRSMSDFSREGRVERYLDCFTGRLRSELEQEYKQMKPEAFAELLQRRSRGVRGVAISDEERPDANTARLRVEWVFEDRNEIQGFTLKKRGDAWKIAAITDARFEKPEIPYGTEVFE